MYLCDIVEWLVSDEDASCAAGVICFLIHYSYLPIWCKYVTSAEKSVAKDLLAMLRLNY